MLHVFVQINLLDFVGVWSGVFKVILGDEGLEGVADNQDDLVSLWRPFSLTIFIEKKVTHKSWQIKLNTKTCFKKSAE